MLLILKYTLLRLLRSKSNIFWILLFPILLGCLFKVAFSNLANTERFHAIPVAIVRENGESADAFCSFAEELGAEGDDQMLVITYCSQEKALELLEKKDVTGILYAGENIALTISSNMNSYQTEQSILTTLVEQYNLNAAIITSVAQTNPEKLPELMASIQDTAEFREEISLSYGSDDTYTQYYYNLIAMACLFTSIGGIYVAIQNQGNQTTLAARKNISCTAKGVAILGELFANVIFETILNMIAFFFLIVVLRVDLTARLPLALLSIFIGCLMSISMGFLIGAIGNRSEGIKTGIMFAITMPCCFFSGLMIGNMRIIIETYVPILNRINPAALISDCFYSINTYESLTRFTVNILSLLVLTVLFCVTGFLLTRRKQYASL